MLARIKNCVENAPKSVTAQHGWQMLYSRRKVCHIYSAALFGKIILRSIKTRQRNGHKLCLFMHCNCYARQSATKNVFLQGHRQLQTAKGIPYRAIIKKSTFCFQKRWRNSWRLFTERKTFSSRKRNAQYVGNSDKHNT